MISVCVRQPVDTDCVVSIESELLNQVSKNGKSWHYETRPIIIQMKKIKIIAIVSPIQNTEYMESPLVMTHNR